MFSIPKKIVQVTTFAIDEQLLDFAATVEAALDSGVGVVDMYVDVVKTSMAAGCVATQQFLSVKDARDWLSLALSQSQRTFEHANACVRQAADTASAAQINFTALMQRRVEAAKKSGLLDTGKTDPGRAVAIKSLPKSALDEGHEGYDIPVFFGKKIKAGKISTVDASEARNQARADDGQV
jgi:hypothetical protein